MHGFFYLMMPNFGADRLSMRLWGVHSVSFFLRLSMMCGETYNMSALGETGREIEEYEKKCQISKNLPICKTIISHSYARLNLQRWKLNSAIQNKSEL